MERQQIIEMLARFEAKMMAMLADDHKERMAWLKDLKFDRKETTACQDAMETNLEKVEPNPGEKEAAVERQETPNEEVAIHPLRAC
jgi:hypothetical protein